MRLRSQLNTLFPKQSLWRTTCGRRRRRRDRSRPCSSSSKPPSRRWRRQLSGASWAQCTACCGAGRCGCRLHTQALHTQWQCLLDIMLQGGCTGALPALRPASSPVPPSCGRAHASTPMPPLLRTPCPRRSVRALPHAPATGETWCSAMPPPSAGWWSRPAPSPAAAQSNSRQPQQQAALLAAALHRLCA